MAPVKRDLSQSVQFLKGVGPARAELLGKLGIATVGDLIFYLPRSYDDLSDVRDIGELTAETLQTVVGEIVEIEGKELNDGRRIVRAVIADAKGKCVEGVWFNQVGAIRGLRYGQKVSFSGKPRWFRDHWQMNHPRVQALDGAGNEPSRQVIPVYSLTEGLYADRLRDYIEQALKMGAAEAVEIVPAPLLERHGFSGVERALHEVHFPQTLAQALAARRRFIYEEFLVMQVALAVRRRELRDRQRAPKLPVDAEIDARIRRLFPFALTRDQSRAVHEVCQDLASDRPMQRLLQADVGAGKTAVAVYAMLVCVANKHQAALMAPTEVLARQHWRTVEGYLAKSRVRRLLLTGGQSAKERQQALEALAAGAIDLVVGTQALVQDKVRFAKLGLVVIDEQHKFGVAQRQRFRKLGADPHYLIMTATPIPRTIALTVFGDLDTSIIKQLPPGRQPVTTRWTSEKERGRTYEHFRKELGQGRQGYVVCPLVEESASVDAAAAQKLYAELKDGPFQGFRVGLLHGRMNDDAKEETMLAFAAGKIDLLVTTVVIEVGIDVPNATLMLIEHAERFGLSQLHQLRGRISRGAVAGECFVMTGVTSEEAQARLLAFRKHRDGFTLAEEDARLRGLGEFFGTRQHGLGELRFGDLLRDRELLEIARRDAIELVKADARLTEPTHAILRQAVIDRYGKTLDLATIG
jgi:ATP-dependent DNA helicase RecG